MSENMDRETAELVNSILDNVTPPVALQFRHNNGWGNESIVHMEPRVLPDGKNY